MGEPIWKTYQLTYRARSPVFLGGRTFGLVQRTRYYAPGWTLWGAITVRLTQFLLSRSQQVNYESIGKFVAENIRTSYAYLLVEGKKAHPWYSNGELRYGALSASQFEARFITTFGQTAIAPSTGTAHTATLRETELLSAYDLKTNKPVQWRFKLYLRQPWHNPPAPVTPEKIKIALTELTLGGARKYGLGWLEQVEWKEEQSPPSCPAGPTPWDWDRKKGILLAHVPWEPNLSNQVRGQVEPISWRWWQGGLNQKQWGPGQKVLTAIFYTPGSIILDETWQPYIDRYGLWRSCTSRS